jgi:catechol 2,3-dioxygenase-like lactoylglutathione lyase family enzyme
VKAEKFISFYPSQDLAATRAFYEEVLGLKLARDQGSCLIFQVTETAFLGFCNHLEPIESPAFIITLVLDNVDGVYRRLLQRHILIDASPTLNEKYQIYHFFALDPNGYKVEVQRFLDPL